MVDIPRLLITAPASGSGKTTFVIGLLHAFRERGLEPTACKCGPDYIDPLFHRHVLGVPGCNLDLFFTPPGQLAGQFSRHASGADIAVIEGVMGYYDGIGVTSEASSWDIAHTLHAPAVIVINARGAAASLAALVRGFVQYRPESMLCGVVLNHCSAALHARLKPLLEAETGLTVFGHIPALPDAVLESRHLGLITPDQILTLRETIHSLARVMGDSVDIDGLIRLAKTAAPLNHAMPAPGHASANQVRIAVAHDPAFCFYYEENFHILREMGAELVSFSPLGDPCLPEGCGGMYIGGGYPELYAEQLSTNYSMRESIRAAVLSGMPTVAECGGFLYLQQEIADDKGVYWPMVGALPGKAANTGGLGRFGYIVLEAVEDTLLCAQGEQVRGHEFHYWDSDTPGASCIAHKAGAEKQWHCIQASASLHAGFPHLALWSSPECARRFVAAAQQY